MREDNKFILYVDNFILIIFLLKKIMTYHLIKGYCSLNLKNHI